MPICKIRIIISKIYFFTVYLFPCLVYEAVFCTAFVAFLLINKYNNDIFFSPRVANLPNKSFICCIFLPCLSMDKHYCTLM